MPPTKVIAAVKRKHSVAIIHENGINLSITVTNLVCIIQLQKIDTNLTTQRKNLNQFTHSYSYVVLGYYINSVHVVAIQSFTTNFDGSNSQVAVTVMLH